MLRLLVEHRYPWRLYLTEWGEQLRWGAQLIPYKDVDDPADLADGTYIFGDIERLPPPGLARARRIWDTLLARGDRVRLLNSPHSVMRRRELLRTLFDIGLNRFNAYGVEEPREAIRYPVFVRSAREHHGPYTPLLHNAAELSTALDELHSKGHDASDLLIVEFLDISSNGTFHKYSVTKLGGTIFPQHAFFSDDWVVKAAKNWTPENVSADKAFLAENPHRDRLEKIFALANIDYGRADYAALGDDIQIWEINTNPVLLLRRSFYGPDRLPEKASFSRSFNAKLAALDAGAKSPSLRDRMAGRLSLQRSALPAWRPRSPA